MNTLRDLSRQSLEEFIDLLPQMVVIFDTELKIKYINQEGLNFYGYSKDEIIGEKLTKILSERTLQDKPIQLDRIKHEEELFIQREVQLKSGEKRNVEAYSILLDDLIFSILYETNNDKLETQDIVESKLKERVKELQCLYRISNILWYNHKEELDRKLKKVVNEIPPGWHYPDITHCKIVMDDKVYTNDGFEESEWYQKSAIFVDSKKEGTIFVYYSEEMPELDEGPFLKEERDLLNNIATKIGRYIERVDIEEKLILSEKILMEKRKMESVGRLAGGIAHDFNNILSVIIGKIELLQLQTEDEELKAGLKEVGEYSLKATELIDKLLTFSRKRIVKPHVFDINQKIIENINLLKGFIDDGIEIEFEVNQNMGWHIKLDESQFDQILINSIINSNDAIKDEGKIFVTTALEEKSHNDTVIKYVKLSIRDTGEGIPKDRLDYIFDPYYSTKEYGDGLGLSITYGIIKQADGLVEVDSKIGEGTTFEYYFPLVQMNTENRNSMEGKIREWENLSILVIDDNREFLKVIKDLLEDEKYNIVLENNPLKILDMDKQELLEFDLIITDVLMPDINGIELSRRVSKKIEKVKFIFMSGYTDSINTFSKEYVDHHFIPKPFSKNELLKKINQVMSLT